MIPVLPFSLHYTPTRPLHLDRFSGSLWRGALGATLRRNACITGAKTCQGCALHNRCAYGFLFETQNLRVSAKPAAGLADYYTNLPHPYIITSEHEAAEYKPGDHIALHITLIGPGTRFLPELLAAVSHLRLHNIPLQLQSIRLHSPLKAEEQDITLAQLLEQPTKTPQPPPAPQTARIHIRSPLRLRRNNRYLDATHFDFVSLFTTLMRRISMLHKLSTGRPLQADYAELANIARQTRIANRQLEYTDWFRRSARQGRKIPMGGVTGHLDITNNLEHLWPWLWAGQWLHVGKGAVMGNGRYTIEYSP